MRHEPRFVLLVDWGENFSGTYKTPDGSISSFEYPKIEYYSTNPDLGIFQILAPEKVPEDFDIDNLPTEPLESLGKLVTVYGAVKEFTNYEDIARVDGLGTSKSIGVTFFDNDGRFYERIMTTPFFSKKIQCKVYMYVGDDRKLLRYLFDGQFQDPFEYDIDTKELRVTINSTDRNETVCYTPKIEDINEHNTCPTLYKILKQNLTTRTWPEIFGTVKNYSSVPIIRPIEFTLVEDVERHPLATWDDPYSLLLDDGGLNLDLTGAKFEITLINKDPAYYGLTVPVTLTTEMVDVEDEEGQTVPTSRHTATFEISDIDEDPIITTGPELDEEGEPTGNDVVIDVQYRQKYFGPEWEIAFEVLPKHSSSEETTTLKLTGWKEGAPRPWLQHMYLGIVVGEGEEAITTVVLCSKQKGDYLICSGTVPATSTVLAWAGKKRSFPAIFPSGTRAIIYQQKMEPGETEINWGGILTREFIKPGVLRIIAGVGLPNTGDEAPCDWFNDYLALHNIFVVDSKEDTEILEVKIKVAEELVTLPTEMWVEGWLPGKTEEEPEPTSFFTGGGSSSSGTVTYQRQEKEEVWPKPDPKDEDLSFWSMQPWKKKAHGGCRFIKLNYLAITELFPEYANGSISQMESPLVTCRSSINTFVTAIQYLCQNYGGFVCDDIVQEPEGPSGQYLMDTSGGTNGAYIFLEDSQVYDPKVNFILDEEESLFDIVSELAWQKVVGVREKFSVVNETFSLELVNLKTPASEDAVDFTFDKNLIDSGPFTLTFTPLQNIRTRLIAYEQSLNQLKPFLTHVKEKNVDLFGNIEYEFNYYAWESEEATQEVLNWWSDKLSTPWLQVKFSSYLDALDVNVLDYVNVKLGEDRPFPALPGTYDLRFFNNNTKVSDKLLTLPELRGRVIEKKIRPEEGLIDFTVETKVRMDTVGKELKRDESIGRYYWAGPRNTRVYVEVPY